MDSRCLVWTGLRHSFTEVLPQRRESGFLSRHRVNKIRRLCDDEVHLSSFRGWKDVFIRTIRVTVFPTTVGGLSGPYREKSLCSDGWDTFVGVDTIEVTRTSSLLRGRGDDTDSWPRWTGEPTLVWRGEYRDDLPHVSVGQVSPLESPCSLVHETKGNLVPREGNVGRQIEGYPRSVVFPVWWSSKCRGDPGHWGTPTTLCLPVTSHRVPKPLHLCVPDSKGPVLLKGVTHTWVILRMTTSSLHPLPTY